MCRKSSREVSCDAEPTVTSSRGKIVAVVYVLFLSGHKQEARMGNEDEARKQAEEDTNEDLELKDEDAGKVTGGQIGNIKWDSAARPLK
jgi:hypothetical protein